MQRTARPPRFACGQPPLMRHSLGAAPIAMTHAHHNKPPCVFWVFLPVVFLLVFSLALGFEYMPRIGKIVSFGVCSAGILLLLATYDAVRFGWAIRALGALVFSAYTFYLVAELREGRKFHLLEPRSTTSPRNALIGLIVFGIPGLIIALHPTRNRTVLKTAAPHNDIDDQEDQGNEGDDPGSRA